MHFSTVGDVSVREGIDASFDRREFEFEGCLEVERVQQTDRGATVNLFVAVVVSQKHKMSNYE